MAETVKRCIRCGRIIAEDELICLSCGSENEMQTFRRTETKIGMTEKIKHIIEHYGKKKQELQAVQELSELILLLAARPEQRGRDYKQHITEEIADCLVMIEQMRLVNNIDTEDILRVAGQKIERQLERIRKEATQ